MVNSTADIEDDTLSDNACKTEDPLPDGSDQCTLRAAIMQANSSSGIDVIWFNIPTNDPGYNPATGSFSIRPSRGALPIIVSPIEIDGYSQSGAVQNNDGSGTNATLKIELNGDLIASAPLGTIGLDVAARDSRISGLVINGFTRAGIYVRGNSLVLNDPPGVQITGNFIGTDVTGYAAVPNHTGIDIAASSDNTTIGGASPELRNLVSGNSRNGIAIGNGIATENVVAGNLIGTDRTGASALPNELSGILISSSFGFNGFPSSNTIGGTQTGARNIISGNGHAGIEIFNGSNNTIIGNYIGTDHSGDNPVPNGYGIDILNRNSTNNTIGGTTPEERNIISGNTKDGIRIVFSADGTTITGNYIGTDDSGGTILPNGKHGIRVEGSENTTIGGDSMAESNVISGNTQAGIFLEGAENNEIRSNFIGTTANGTSALPNGDGIYLSNSSSNSISGSPTGQLVIAGNSNAGIQLRGDSFTNHIYYTYIGTTNGTDVVPNAIGIAIEEGARANEIGDGSPEKRNIISGNLSAGIVLSGEKTEGNLIRGNYIGPDQTGLAPVTHPGAGDPLYGNLQYGIVIQNGAHNNIIGGTTAEGNLISGNSGYGILIIGQKTAANNISGNIIGGDSNKECTADPSSGDCYMGNGRHGILVKDNANNNLIGSMADNDKGNTIAFNGYTFDLQGHGLVIESGIGNIIRYNSIFDNHGRGINLITPAGQPNAQYPFTINDNLDADNGPNNLQNYPVVDKVSFSAGQKTIVWLINGTPGARITLDFYANDELDPSGFGEGKTHLDFGIVPLNGQGKGSYSFTTAASNTYIAATATSSDGNTSEFSIVDTDGDAIADAWETAGMGLNVDENSDANGSPIIDLDLSAMGANPLHKDLFVEIDAMNGLAPSQAVLNMVSNGRNPTEGFANAPAALVNNPDGTKGINLYFITDPADLQIPQAEWNQPLSNNWPPEFNPTKNQYFGNAVDRNPANPNSANVLNAKRLVFRYGLFAFNHGARKTSGVGERGGNDFIVSLGRWTDESGNPGGTDLDKAGTLMHELGHTLGLHHGGHDDINCKPNYHSVMNYTWQTPYNAYLNSWTLNYSDQLFALVNENSIDTQVGLGGHAGHQVPVGPKMDSNGTPTANILVDESGPFPPNFVVPSDPNIPNVGPRDISFIMNTCISDENGDGTVDHQDTELNVLEPAVDWDKLVYYFQGSKDFADGVHSDEQVIEEITLEGVEALNAIGSGPGQLQFSRALPEATELDGYATISVVRAGGMDGVVTVDYATTSGGTATAGVDFTAVSGTLTFPDLVHIQTFTVPVSLDALTENLETIEISLSNPSGGAALGTYTTLAVRLYDDLEPGVIEFAENYTFAGEETGQAEVELVRTNGRFGAVSVVLSTSDDSAVAGSDYTNFNQTVVFGNGEVTKTVAISLNDDSSQEYTEIINLSLSNPGGGATLGEKSLAQVHILDDELPNSTYVVVNTADSGIGSLRQALINANNSPGLDTILFDIPGSGVQSIVLLTELPTITGPVIIDGFSQPGASPNTLETGSDAVLLIELDGHNLTNITNHGLELYADNSVIRGLVIHSFRGYGIDIKGSGNLIEGSYIGTDASGSQDLGNGENGINLSVGYDNQIGGGRPASRMVLSGNGNYGLMNTSFTTGTVVQGSYIGVQADGVSPLGNDSTGIGMFGAQAVIGGFLPGQANIIANNYDNGIEGTGGGKPTVLGNSIYANGRAALIIQLEEWIRTNVVGDFEPEVNSPSLSSATYQEGQLVITGWLDSSQADTDYLIQFYANDEIEPTGYGEAKYFLGSVDVTTDSSGNAEFAIRLPLTLPAGQVLVATATDFSRGTSEFSARLGVGDTPPAFAVVNTTDDVDDGICDETHCSLREAILNANNHPSLSYIIFNIGAGHQTIRPLTPLPPVTGPTVIDGTSQPGFGGTPIIELSGNLINPNLSPNRFGLWLTGGNSTVRGLVINQFVQALWVGNGTSSYEALGGNVIQGNYIGTDVTGLVASPNGGGVFIRNSPGNLIGGTTPDDRNLISGNLSDGIYLNATTIYENGQFIDVHAKDNIIQGNYIGVDVTGSQPLGNGGYGMLVPGARTIIGGDTPGAGNVISANGKAGIGIGVRPAGNGSTIMGNLIGTDATGSQPLGNGWYGIDMTSSTNVFSGTLPAIQVGGSTPGAGNVIAANGYAGIRLYSSAEGRFSIQGNFIGTNISGTVAFPNNGGIDLSGRNNLVEGNLVSGNQSYGLRLVNTNTYSNSIAANLVGVQSDGISPLGNATDGILITQGAFNNTVVSNTIAFNGGNGVMINDTAVHNTLSTNNIHSNNGLGIDLAPQGVSANDSGDGDSGPNDLQNFPVVVSAESGTDSTIVTVALNSAPNTDFVIELFSSDTADPSGFGEGRQYLEQFNLTTNNNGVRQARIILPGELPAGSYVAALATDSSGSTSEFSAAVQVTNMPQPAPDSEYAQESQRGTAEYNDNAPPVAIPGGPYTTNEGQTITLDGSGSFPIGGSSITAYAWDLDNDGQFDDATGATTPFIPADNGLYPIAFQVTDDISQTAEAALVVTVANVAPTVDAGASQTILVGTGLTLTATITDPGSLDTHTATIDWSDGFTETAVVDQSSLSLSAQHTYATAGTYLADVCVTDNDGDTGCDFLAVIVSQPSLDADLAITQTDSADPVGIGAVVTHTFVIENLGGATAEEVEVYIELPTSVIMQELTTTQGSCLDFDEEIFCFLGDMAPGSQVIIEVSVVRNTTGYFIIYGEVNSRTGESDYSNNDSGEFTQVINNQAPVAVDDSRNGVEDTPLTIDVLSNDSDPDGNALMVTAVVQPANGAAVINPDNTITYTPDPDYNLNDSAGGPDSFSYTINDGYSNASATVAVTVSPVNDNPAAADDDITTNEDTAVLIDLLANDNDVDGDTLTITAVSAPTLGSLADNGDGTYTYTPAANLSGTDVFSYTITDGSGTASANVTVTIVPANDAPAAVDDPVITDEDTPVIVAVLDNDSDLDGDALTVTAVNAPANGTAAINGDGTVTYTPSANFNGSDSFLYTVSDGQGAMDTAAVLVTVNPVNDAPMALDDSAAVLEDTQIVLDVLANDSDVDGDVLAVSITTTPQYGTAVANQDGTVSYTPAPSFNGIDTLTYTVADGNGGTDTALVTLNVTPDNDNPVAVDDEVWTAEDTAVVIDVLANDSDVDGDVLSVTAVTSPTTGLVAVNPDSTLTYTPAQNFAGDASFAYTTGDGFGGSDTALVTIHVTPVNDAPAAADDSAVTNEDTPVTVEVLANDDDVDGDGLLVTAVTTPTHGTAVLNPDGTITYQPDADYNGGDSLVYDISDGFGGSDSAVLYLTVAPVNDDPLAVDDSQATDEDTAVTITVLANDSDVDGDSLVVTNVTLPANGTAVIKLDNTIVYTPTANFNGADSFAYTIDDGAGGTAVANVIILVQAVNDAPDAADDSQTTDEDTAVTVDILANDGDIDGDSLVVSSVSAPANGTATINGDGTVTYTPDANFNGTDSFGYVLGDGNGGSDTAVITIVVNPVNDAPSAADDATLTPEDTAVTLDVLMNDSDVDGDQLAVAGVTAPANGTAAANPDGTVTYTPDANFNGVDSFTYTLDDGNGGSDTATVTITVSSDNDNPVAAADSATTNEDTAVAIPVLDNDSDLDGDTLSVSSLTQPANGTAVANPDGTVTYTPDADYFGPDSFVYTLSDGQGGSDSAVVSVTVQAVNDAPVAVDDSALTIQDTAVTVPVLLNDSDVEGDPLTVTAVGTPANGSVVANPDGSVTYTPGPAFTGTDSFTYTVVDGQGGSATATVTITVIEAGSGCELYPIALDAALLANAQPGDILSDILNGEQPGSFGWLTWNGNNSTPSLIASLTPPGNSDIYTNPYDPNDQSLSAGDWVQGKPGVSNAQGVRDALDLLKMVEIVVPVWDVVEGSGANATYHITGFARVRILDYNLAGQDQITAEFLGFTTCGE